MHKKITVCIFGERNRLIHAVSLSKFHCLCSSIVCLAGLILIVAFLIDYAHLLQVRRYSEKLKLDHSLQRFEIARQHRHIQFFANEINLLLKTLTAFNRFERKIRIISNIETPRSVENPYVMHANFSEDMHPDATASSGRIALIREMHHRLELAEEGAAMQHQGFQSLLNYLEDQRQLLASTPSIWPVKGWISSAFGPRQSPFTDRSEFHKGIDIAAKNGGTVIATADGTVTFAGRKGTMGKMVVIDHGHGMSTRYGHLRKLLKKRGDSVKRGEIIGRVGRSGRTTGPHLHYEVRLNGIALKPMSYILN